MKRLLFFALILSTGVLASCEDSSEDEVLVAPEERIVGQWIIDNVTVIGLQAPDGESYLEFNACNPECTGTYYNSSDQTQGTFTYSLNEAGTEITITDGSANGGAYDGTWTISDFTNNSMTVSGTTLFGETSMNMSKN